MTVSLTVDPDDLSTAQQKQIDFRRRMVFPNKRVLRGMNLVYLNAVQHTSRVVSECPHGSCIALSATFYSAYPKATAKKNLIDNDLMPEKWDLDNKFKSVGDALTKAGWWPDDRFITSLSLHKRRTTGTPRIEIEVTVDR